jgi:hypothetical protein
MFRLIFKILTSKKTRKVAKKAAKTVRKNVKVEIAGRGVDVSVAKKKFRVDAETFKRPTQSETANPFA